jgi:hypothetical protein
MNQVGPTHSPRPEPHAKPGASGLPAVVGLLVTMLVFGAFVAYAMLAPATYRATALITLQPAPGQQLSVSDPNTAASRLRDAALDAEGLAEVSGEFALGSSSSAEREGKQRMQDVLRIVPKDAMAFEVHVTDADAARAQRLCNVLARRAAGHASEALGATGPASSGGTDTAELKNRRVRELESFLAAHPELNPPVVAPAASGQAQAEAEREAKLAQLRTERDQLQARIAKAPPSADSDNPYADSGPGGVNVALLRRRLDEINAVVRRMTEKKPAASSAPVAPEVTAELRRLQAAVAETPPPVANKPTSLTVHLSEAVLPSEPLSPQRNRLFSIGAGVALLFGVLAAAGIYAALRASSRPSAQRASAQPPPVQQRVAERAPADATGSDPPPRQQSDPPPRQQSDPPAKISSAPPAAPSSPPPAHISSHPPGQGSPQPPLHATGAPPAQALTSNMIQVGGNSPARSAAPPQEITRNTAPPQEAAPTTARLTGSPVVPAAPATPSLPAQRNEPLRPAAMHAVHATSAPPGQASAAPPAVQPKPVIKAQPQAQPAAAPKAQPAAAPKAQPAAAPKAQPTAAPKAQPAAAPKAQPTAAPRPQSVQPQKPAASQPEPSPYAAQASALSGFAIVPAPIRTPLPPLPPGGSAPAPEPAPARIFDTTASAVTSPTVPPPPPEAPLKQQGPTGIQVASRTLTGMQLPPDVTTGPDAQPPRARGRTTQMLGSPIPPVLRTSRPPPAHSQRPSQPAPQIERALPTRSQPPERSSQYLSRTPAADRVQRESQHPKPTPSGYSYVSTPPPPAYPSRQNTPSFYSQANKDGRSGYLSTPSPEPEPPGDERAPRPSVVTHSVHSGWKLDPQLRFEARRQLADELFPLAVAGCFILGVTGVPEARAHKPWVAAELALALAEARHPRVLLVEADFQWPTLHSLLHIDMPPSLGFSQQLRARAYNDQWHVVEITPTLHVMAEGIMRSPGLILSSHFEDSLRSFRSYYDFVIADGPLLSAEVDCRAFDSVIDGVAIVSTSPASPWLSGSPALFSDKRYSTVVSIGPT